MLNLLSRGVNESGQKMVDTVCDLLDHLENYNLDTNSLVIPMPKNLLEIMSTGVILKRSLKWLIVNELLLIRKKLQNFVIIMYKYVI